eukprot:COSAG04_NODE_31505_length_256_cov_0.974522_1_plen_65_part_10
MNRRPAAVSLGHNTRVVAGWCTPRTGGDTRQSSEPPRRRGPVSPTRVVHSRVGEGLSVETSDGAA